MALSIILGSSGSGKSTYAYDKIIEESLENKDKNYLVIVPEQYTMATQMLLVEKHPNKCIMNIDVLSFNRLAYRVFEELGLEVLDILDDTGKSLVLRKLVSDHLNQLTALKKNMTRISYITQVKSLISEMTQYNITPDTLKEMMAYGPMSESFRRKAADLLVLYQAFIDFTDGKYITTEAILSQLNACLPDSKMVADSVVVLDGFTGFTPIQYQLLSSMLKICQDVYVTVTGDISESYFEKKADDDLFEMSSVFVRSLNEIAKKDQVKINDPILIDNSKGRFSNNPVLSHLESNLFRKTYKKYLGQDAPEAIELTSLKNPRDELSYVAQEISRLIRGGDYTYKDFAVVCPNLGQYRYLVSEIWDAYKIPYFIDAKTEILFHPFVEAIDAIFEIFDTNFSKDSVFRFLRTGYTNLSLEEIDTLENYVISTGIRGKNKYFHPFAIRSNTFKKDEDLARVNAIRTEFIKGFAELDQAFHDEPTVRSIAVALYNYLFSLDCQDKISAREKYFEENKQLVRAKEYSQIYKLVMNILDKMVAILGEEPMAPQDFSDVLQAGLSAASIGVIPQANDSVIIGDMERTRIGEIKILFCIGASDDAIPKKVENGGILSQLEREQLLERFEMAPSDRQKAFRQRFYLYMMLTKPRKKLYVISPRVGCDGKACNMSYIMELLHQMFPAVSVNIIENFDSERNLLSITGARDLLIELVKKAAKNGLNSFSVEETEMLKSLLAWGQESKNVSLDQVLDAVFYKHTGEGISADVMLLINEAFNEDETVSGSVSKFEDYSDCAYKFFLKYILKVDQREEAELSTIDMGNFYHNALARFGQLLKDDNKKWATITEEERNSYIDVAINDTYMHMDKVHTLEDATQSYIVDTMKATLKYTVEVITEQVKRGAFEPYAFEEKITADIISPSSEEIVGKLKGSVDRVDMTENLDDNALRIIDYKSSSHKLSLDECYYGLSLQLPVYMKVVLEKIREKYPDLKVHPSALLYYKTDNPFVTVKPGESVSETRLTELKMDGLVSEEKDDLFYNDKSLNQASTKSAIVPVTTTKDGTVDKNSHTVPQDGFGVIIDYSMQKAGEIAQNILDGHFDISPARLGNKIDACTYCDYKSICHFDENTDGFKARDLEPLGTDALTLMKKAMNIATGEGGDENAAD